MASHRPLVRLIALLATLIGLFFTARASAADFTPPPLTGHVVDQAGALEPQQVRALDRKLDRARRQSGFAVVVYLLAKLPEGMAIEDVGYAAGNAWGVGSKGGDDGVLLVAVLEDRKLRIETGKGAGGGLTDVASSHINKEVIGPLLAKGQTYEAMDRGADAILKELQENTPGGTSNVGRGPARRGNPTAAPAAPMSGLKMGLIAAGIIGVIILAIVSPGFRQMLFWVLLFGRFGGGGRRDDDDGGGGGGGGSGYGGGGGTFGGGGSSDDY